MGVLLRTYHFSLSLDKTIRLFVKNFGFLLIINKDLLNYKIFYVLNIIYPVEIRYINIDAN
jgi:hypothetical protein